MRILAIFRREFRMADNPLLDGADGAEIVPVFVLDGYNLGEFGGNPTAFFFAALRLFREELERRGGRLYVVGAEDLGAFVERVRPDVVRYALDVEPHARERDRGVEELARRVGARVEAGWDNLIAPVAERMYPNFGMFWKKHVLGNAEVWREREAPGRLRVPEVEWEEAELPGAESGAAGAWLADEAAVLRKWEDFLANGLGTYMDWRDFPGRDRSSRLSPYLRTGLISVRRIFAQAWGVSEEFAREVAWGDFFAHVLWNAPETPEQELRPGWRGFPWEEDAGAFAVWREGRTGLALVDAGMRQLAAEGWMHNRVRMVVASFLTRHLRLDWRLGERHFRDLLVDAELARNVGNWQWAAGCGADAQPYFRVFNPVLQAGKFDPDGEYIRRYVPELARVPAQALRSALGRGADLSGLARDYPPPMVNLAAARADYLRVAKEYLGRSGGGRS